MSAGLSAAAEQATALRLVAARGRRVCGLAVHVGRREAAERLAGLRVAAGDRDRACLVDGARDVAVARHANVRDAAEQAGDVVLRDAHATVGAIEDDLDA